MTTKALTLLVFGSDSRSAVRQCFSTTLPSRIAELLAMPGGSSDNYGVRVSHWCRSKSRRNDITRAGCRQCETQEPESFQVGAETDAGR
jgi:hypothetical protein